MSKKSKTKHITFKESPTPRKSTTYHDNVYETIRGILKKLDQCLKNGYNNEVHKHHKMLKRLKKYADRSE